MGNHTAGRNIVDFIEVAASLGVEPQTQDAAMALLADAVSRASARADWSPDTEFDDAPYADGPFRRALALAFAPDADFGDDAGGDRFFDEAYWPFKQCFGMC